MRPSANAEQRSLEAFYADARENALRSAARLATAREASERRRHAVLAQRRLDREQRDSRAADRLGSVYTPVNRLSP
jgi:hypothetical protein